MGAAAVVMRRHGHGDTGTRGSKCSRMGAMAAEMEPLDSDAEVEATSSLRDVAIESEGTMRSNGPPCVETAPADAERRARLEREEARATKSRPRHIGCKARRGRWVALWEERRVAAAEADTAEAAGAADPTGRVAEGVGGWARPPAT